jgi:hypothetical protein
MRQPRTDVCIFDKAIRRSCGHEQRYVCRIKDEQTRTRRVAELEASPCRACSLVRELAANHGHGARPELGEFVCNQRLEDLRLFVPGVLSSLEATKDEPEPFQHEVMELARRLLGSTGQAYHPA